MVIARGDWNDPEGVFDVLFDKVAPSTRLTNQVEYVGEAGVY